VLAVLSLITVVVAFRPLMIHAFDAVFARTIGYPTGVIHYAQMILMSLVIVASIQAVGVVLVVAMLITPAAAARLLTRRLPSMLVTAALIGALSGYLGALLSYLVPGWSSGPTMVLVASAVFALAWLLGPQGLLVKTWQERQRNIARQRGLIVALIKDRAQGQGEVALSHLKTLATMSPQRLNQHLNALVRTGEVCREGDVVWVGRPQGIDHNTGRRDHARRSLRSVY